MPYRSVKTVYKIPTCSEDNGGLHEPLFGTNVTKTIQIKQNVSDAAVFSVDNVACSDISICVVQLRSWMRRIWRIANNEEAWYLCFVSPRFAIDLPPFSCLRHSTSALNLDLTPSPNISKTRQLWMLGYRLELILWDLIAWRLLSLAL